MATIRAKDLPGSISAFGNSDYIAADENASGETRKVNKDSIRAGLGLATNRKTVVSTTNPTPDFVGQPGIDANGKTYVAISLTGTMWEELGKVDTYTLAKDSNNLKIDRSFLSAEILESSIKFNTGKNLINGNLVQSNFILNSGTGTVGASSGWATTSFIKVSPSTQYTVRWVRRICYYNENKVFISGTDFGTLVQQTFTTPALTKYLRISFYTGQEFTTQLELGASSTVFETYFISIDTIDGAEVKVFNVADTDVVKKTQYEEDIVYSLFGKNLYNKNNSSTDTLLNLSTGGTSVSAGWATSGFTKIRTITAYALRWCRYVCFYDTNKIFISSLDPGSEIAYSFTPPALTSYVRFSFGNSRVATNQLELGSSFSSFQAHHIKIDTKNSVKIYADEDIFYSLKQWFLNESFEPTSGTLTYDSLGNVITPLNITFPDGGTGVLTITRDSNFDFLSATMTYIKGDFSLTLTQPSVTRDSEGNVITKPAITIA